MVDFCVERRLCISNTYFKHKCLHKYAMVSGAKGRIEVMRMRPLRSFCCIMEREVGVFMEIKEDYK